MRLYNTVKQCYAFMANAYKVKLKDANVVGSAERGSRDRGPNSYSVRLRLNTVCTRILWNRDVNAAINTLRLFLDWVEGRTKPLEFRRAAL